MQFEKNVALDCPYCRESIFETISWFKKTYSTCPHCEKGLSSGQFEAAIVELEMAMDASIEEMLYGETKGGCCGDKSSCGGGCH